MNVLIDTSVWVDHFCQPNAQLVSLLQADAAMGHPLVLAELACGTPPGPRGQTLSHIGLLRPVHQASLAEVVDFIERERLYGLGCGVVDSTLLASTCITPSARIWTLDTRLAMLAQRFNVAYQPAFH